MTKKHALLSLTLVLIIATNTWQEAECVSSQKLELGAEGAASVLGSRKYFELLKYKSQTQEAWPSFPGRPSCALHPWWQPISAPLLLSPQPCPQVNFVILLINGLHNCQASNRPRHPVINTFNPKNLCLAPWAAKPRKLTFLWVGVPQVNSWVISNNSNKSLVFDLSPNLFSQEKHFNGTFFSGVSFCDTQGNVIFGDLWLSAKLWLKLEAVLEI